MSEPEQLDDVASIRKRPGMYLGDVTNRAGTHHMAWEVLANAIDEYLAGRCTRIDLTMHSDGSLSVADDGAGISLEPDESDTSWLERVLTTLHDTATADGHSPHVHLRHFHVGLCMVSALSSSFSAEVRRDGQTWRIELERGRVTRPLGGIGPAVTTGTTVRFKPDDTVFAMPDFEVETVARRVRETSSLLPGLVTSFSCEGHEYGSEVKVAQLLESPRYGTREHREPVTGEARQRDAVARIAFEWRDWPSEPTVIGYCNLDVTPEGTHIDGFRQGLAEGLGRRDHRRVFDALSIGLNAVVSVLVIDPQYQGPTREKIASKEARAVVKEATARAIERAMASDKDLAGRITYLLTDAKQ
ncbi:MAG: ATP-binding protein [Sandaracinaceae bacterium]